MFLLIDNYDSFTFNLVQAFLQLGRKPVVVKNDDPTLLEMVKREDLEMVCISPGPGRPENAGFCLSFLAALSHKVPVLGVCLGHQILGHAADASIMVGKNIMHGKQSYIEHDGAGLFHGIQSPMRVGRYHSLLVAGDSMPENLEVTASCKTQDGEREVMGLCYKDRPWVGVQFHPESVLTPEGMRLLANFPAGIQAQERRNGTVPSILPVQRTKNPIQMATVIEKLAQREDLDVDTAAVAFSRLMGGELSASQAGALLLGLRAKGETPEEVGEAALAVLARAVPVPPVDVPCMDIVGTGGDNKFSFNCSTATSLTLAGMGYKVLKHGNRSVSSRCGSADVLEQLGIPLDTPPEAVPRTLREVGFVFLFAPRYHPSFQHVMPVRRELGVRTLFNILGPLVNPARPDHHFLGVPEPSQLSLVAETLARTSQGSGAVVHGAGGYDELTTMGKAQIIFVEKGVTRSGTLDPAEYGFTPCTEQELAVEGPEHAVTVLRELLHGGGPQAMREMLVLNLAFALYLMQNDQKTDYDADCGYNRERMSNAMKDAGKAVAEGVGRRFCHA